MELRSEDGSTIAMLKRLVAEAVRDANGGQAIEVDENASLTSFGLDSVGMVTLVSRVEEEVGFELAPELAFDYPTIRALAGRIALLKAENDA